MTSSDVVARSALSRDSPLKLLLIEDSLSDSDLVVALLEDELPQAKVHVAANLEKALVLLGGNRYDAVLADLSLPDADGQTVVQALRSTHPDTALLVLTGRADGGLALWTLAHGAQEYIVKGQHDGPRLANALLHALQRQRSEQEARKYLELARGLLDALEEPNCAVAANGDIIATNKAWGQFAATNTAEGHAWAEGSNYLLACDQVPADTADSRIAAAIRSGLQKVLAGDISRYQQEYAYGGSAEGLWYSVRIAPAVFDGNRGAVITHVDITTLHAIQEALSHQALHDALTGLPNRVLLTDRLGQALSDSGRRREQVGVALIDLDHFKRVNDSLGHPAGDTLLVQVAERLSRVLRAGDTLSRLAADEFVVVWRDLASPDDVGALGKRLLDAMMEPFEVNATSLTVSASIGVAVGQSPTSVEDLLQAADAAMYDAKAHGRDRVRIFSDELRHGAQDRMAVEVGLRSALVRDELVLHYQPVIDLANGRPVGIEALVRWQHPERGLVPPNHFIPIAEATGLVVPLGVWALEQACRDAMSLTGAASGIDIAVNLSTRQLAEPDLIAHVRDALASSGLDPNRLLLEVTESAVMEDEQVAANAIQALSQLGVRIAIDDFGTGYSSLLYLRRYPISALKIDRAFVSGIGASHDDEAICSSVVSLAHAVGATSIGEGVETTEQYAALRAFGCQQAQGFLWSPAVPIADLPGVLLACRDVPIPPAAPRNPPALKQLQPDIASRITSLHRSGASLQTIAANLNRDAVQSPSGVHWTANDIARQLAA